MHIHVHAFWICVHIPDRFMPRSKSAGSEGIYICSVLVDNAKLLFKMILPFLTGSTVCKFSVLFATPQYCESF